MVAQRILPFCCYNVIHSSLSLYRLQLAYLSVRQVVTVSCIRNQDLELSKVELLETLPGQAPSERILLKIVAYCRHFRLRVGVLMGGIFWLLRQVRASSMPSASERSLPYSVLLPAVPLISLGSHIHRGWRVTVSRL